MLECCRYSSPGSMEMVVYSLDHTQASPRSFFHSCGKACEKSCERRPGYEAIFVLLAGFIPPSLALGALLIFALAMVLKSLFHVVINTKLFRTLKCLVRSPSTVYSMNFCREEHSILCASHFWYFGLNIAIGTVF